jgi:predicted PhzF superfamily epimerase YddE/YHI9
MAIRLTEQQHALDTTDAEPPQVVDPRTNAAYVLIPLTEYETVREIVEDERQQRAIRAVGLRNAGLVAVEEDEAERLSSRLG